MKSTDRGDPRTARDPLRTRRNGLLNIPNRVGILERRVVARTISHQHDVIVIVDNAGHDRAPPQINDADARSPPGSRAAHCGEAAISDRYRLDNRVVVVHRVNSAVDQGELFGPYRSSGAGLLDCSKAAAAKRCCDARRSGPTEQLPARETFCLIVTHRFVDCIKLNENFSEAGRGCRGLAARPALAGRARLRISRPA